MTIEYRPITEDEYPAFLRAEGRGFFRHVTEDEATNSKRRERFELARGLAAFDGKSIVGTTGAYSLRMTVPGAPDVPTAGITDVTVQATHRRRGILTELTRRQLRDIHEREEPLAALWTSETMIYGRFGYGMAFQQESWNTLPVPRRRARLSSAPGSGSSRSWVARRWGVRSWRPAPRI